VAVDGADAADHAVGRRALDEVLHRSAATLRGDHHRAVFDEGSGVDEVGHVLAGGSPAELRRRATAVGRAASSPTS
jgi:hypothetical protein